MRIVVRPVKYRKHRGPSTRAWEVKIEMDDMADLCLDHPYTTKRAAVRAALRMHRRLWEQVKGHDLFIVAIGLDGTETSV